MARVTELPFRAIGGHMVVDARIDGAPVSLMFDTGADITILTDNAVQRLRLRGAFGWYGEATGIGGSRVLTAARTRKFELGDLHGADFTFPAATVDFPGDEAGIDGVLGTNFLSKYDIDLDIPDRRIILYYPTGSCSDPAAVLKPPLYSIPLVRTADSSSPSVDTVIQGHHLRAAIDTGSPDSTIFRGPAADFGLHIDALTEDPKGMTGGIGPRKVRAVQHVFAPITIGDLTIEHLPVVILDQRRVGLDAMLLGMDFVARVHLWISNSSHTLIMQFPPAPSPPADDGAEQPRPKA